MTAQILFWALSLTAAIGAVAVIASREVMRMALGLGVFLLSLAGFFALFGFGFMGLAEIFVYVGGVLILVLFAIMLVHREEPGRPSIDSRHDPVAAVAAAGVGMLLAVMLRPIVPAALVSAKVSQDGLGSVLLGKMLPHFEMAGLLLLAALVAVVAVNGEDAE